MNFKNFIKIRKAKNKKVETIKGNESALVQYIAENKIKIGGVALATALAIMPLEPDPTENKEIYAKIHNHIQEENYKEYKTEISRIRGNEIADGFVNDTNYSDSLTAMKMETNELVERTNAAIFMRKRNEIKTFIEDKVKLNQKKYDLKIHPVLATEMKKQMKDINFLRINAVEMRELKKDFNSQIENHFKARDLDIKIENTRDAINNKTSRVNITSNKRRPKL